MQLREIETAFCMIQPENYIRIYPVLPSGKTPLKEEEKLLLTSNEAEQQNKRVIPETIIEFNVWEKNGIVSVNKHKECHYDRKGRQTSRFSFGYNESQVLEEFWRFSENNKLDEYLRRHIRGEIDFTKFIYNKSNKIERIIRFDLSEYGITKKYLFEYNADENVNSIVNIGFDGLPEETTVFTYDADKRITKKELFNTQKELVKYFEYDYNILKLVSQEKSFSGNGSENTITDFAYDDFNRLIEKKVRFKTSVELEQNSYKGEYLISTVKELISDGKSIKRNEWVADIYNFTIIEKNFGTANFEQKIQYDENWLPKRGVLKSFDEEIDSYEIRFVTSIHD